MKFQRYFEKSEKNPQNILDLPKTSRQNWDVSSKKSPKHPETSQF
jgi:hypothetical protein